MSTMSSDLLRTIRLLRPISQLVFRNFKSRAGLSRIPLPVDNQLWLVHKYELIKKGLKRIGDVAVSVIVYGVSYIFYKLLSGRSGGTTRQDPEVPCSKELKITPENKEPFISLIGVGVSKKVILIPIIGVSLLGCYLSWRATRSTITIAAATTPSRAGGLLVLPEQKLVYFYSIPLPCTLDFFLSKPDNVEMISAYLALSIFEKYVTAHRRIEDEVVLKTVDAQQGNAAAAGWKQLCSKVQHKLNGQPFKGRWTQVFSQADEDHFTRIAAKLSEPGYILRSQIEDLNPLKGYTFKNVSSGHQAMFCTVFWKWFREVMIDGDV